MPAPNLYPPAPEGVPENFTRPSPAYQLRTVAVLASLVAFLVLYLVLVAAAGCAAWWLVQARPATLPHGTNSVVIVIVAYVGGLAAIAMLLAFLVKGLFKRHASDRAGHVAVTRAEQPELFRFIDRVCEETGAPRPAGVYISPDVNAAVFYDTSLLNLIVPPRKNLLIGAGLVNAVNLREFKAVLAHEFGHFSQKSLALGTYVYVANRVLHDIVHGRDSWDDVLAKWCRLDLRLSFPAWGLRGVLWTIRRGLAQVFKGINLLNFSLSRQMEFNADDVAVSVAGSHAIVSALCRLEFADHCHGFAAGELATAADHGLYSRDIFHHQHCAVAHLRAVSGRPDMGVPPAAPARVFAAGESSSVPQMWRSHPANSDRETNARRHWLAAADDDRSPWLLFADREALCARLSAAFYTTRGKPVTAADLDDPGPVQAFIDAERAETRQDPKYHGLFDGRALRLDPAAVAAPDDPQAPAREALVGYFGAFPPPGLAAVMAAHTRRMEEARLLEALKSGNLTLTGKTFAFRDRDATIKEVPGLLADVNAELQRDSARFAAWDAAMYAHHYQAAYRLDPARAADLKRRYQLQLTVQSWLFELRARREAALEALQPASGDGITREQFVSIRQTLQALAGRLAEVYAAAADLPCPAMSNVAEGTPLSDLIRPADFQPPTFGDDTIPSGAVSAVITASGYTLEKLPRMFFKGMGNILSRQEAIAADFIAAEAPAAPAVADPATAAGR